MPLVRDVPAETEFERAFIPYDGAVYLATVIEVRDRDDQGRGFIKPWVDRDTGETKNRAAVVVVFRIEDVLSPGKWPDKATYEANRQRNPLAPVGDTVGKKYTDSLAPSARLRKDFEKLTGYKVDELPSVDLELMLGKRVQLSMGGREQYDPQGRLGHRHWVEDLTLYFPPGSAGASEPQFQDEVPYK